MSTKTPKNENPEAVEAVAPVDEFAVAREAALKEGKVAIELAATERSAVALRIDN